MQFQNFFTKNSMLTADDRMGTYVKIALVFFIAFVLISVGYILGLQKRQHMQVGSDQSVDANVAVTEENDLTKEIINHLTNTSVEYGSWKSTARLYRPEELGLNPSAYGSLLGIRNVHPGIQIQVVSVSDETLRAMSDPEVRLPESLSDMYQQKPVLAPTEPYGLVLVTPTSTPSRITWLSKVNNQPVVFLVEFPQSSRSELVVRYNADQSEIEFGHGMDEEQSLFNHILDLYPSDQKLTEDFHNNLRARRDTNHGYNFQDTVATGTSQGGNTFVLKQYNDEDVNSTGPCQGFADPSERQDHAPSDSCVFTVSLNGTTITLRDEELSVLGGVPKKWLNDSEIMVENEYCGGLGCDWRLVTGVYDVTTKKSKTLVEQYTRCPWLGLSINFKGQEYILAAPEFEQSTSTLYKINSGRKFEDFFVPTDRSDNHCGPHMVLNESLISELTSLAEFPSVSLSDIDPKIIKQNPTQDAELILGGRNNNSFILK
jgi:hypothetical protein